MVSLLLASGCPSDDSDATGGSSSSSETGEPTTTPMTSATATATNPTATMTDATGDTSSDTATATEESSSTNDPDTSGGSESGGSESGGSESGSSSGSSEDSSSSESTGGPVCEPFGDECLDCVFTESCCPEYSGCLELADCSCYVGCLFQTNDLEGCLDVCELNGPPPGFVEIEGCAMQAPCNQACAKQG